MGVYYMKMKTLGTGFHTLVHVYLFKKNQHYILAFFVASS